MKMSEECIMKMKMSENDETWKVMMIKFFAIGKLFLIFHY